MPREGAAGMRDAFSETEDMDSEDLWPEPDMTVLRLHRRSPPALPLNVFGVPWKHWIEVAAQSAACPVDYVASGVIASASALIGNARWALAWPGWEEPPHLWCGAVGDSGNGKSPGSDALMRHVLPVIEHRMVGDFPDRLSDWKSAAEVYAASLECWKSEVRTARKKGDPAPAPPGGEPPPQPQSPRLRQTDVTIERVATLLASAAPKGLLIVRDELAGWLLGMNAYNDAGRAFWIEAYGGRPYRVERQKHPEPIDVPRLVVAVTGGTQPDKLAELLRDGDDGLFARVCWFWPEPIPFDLSHTSAAASWAVDALDRLRLLELVPGAEPSMPDQPLVVPLAKAAVVLLRDFGREMQERQQEAGGLMRSALGKARGIALRLSLVLEFLWWCALDGIGAPPREISEKAFVAAAHFVVDYLMPMAERVYGDATVRREDRNAATLARWIVKTKAAEVHVRKMQRKIRLPGLADAETIRGAATVLVEAGWLMSPKIGFGTASKVTYAVNPRVLEARS
jgi:hypothetical protein